MCVCMCVCVHVRVCVHVHALVCGGCARLVLRLCLEMEALCCVVFKKLHDETQAHVSQRTRNNCHAMTYVSSLSNRGYRAAARNDMLHAGCGIESIDTYQNCSVHAIHTAHCGASLRVSHREGLCAAVHA